VRLTSGPGPVRPAYWRSPSVAGRGLTWRHVRPWLFHDTIRANLDRLVPPVPSYVVRDAACCKRHDRTIR
jgi:hypothetical protein